MPVVHRLRAILGDPALMFTVLGLSLFGVAMIYSAGQLDAVYVVFARFLSPVSTPPTTLQILPVEPPRADGRIGGSADRHSPGEPAPAPAGRRTANYILSPSADEIVGAILPLYVRNAMYRALVENVAAEQGARRTAMNASAILRICPSNRPMAMLGESWNRWFTQGNGYGLYG